MSIRADDPLSQIMKSWIQPTSCRRLTIIRIAWNGLKLQNKMTIQNLGKDIVQVVKWRQLPILDEVRSSLSKATKVNWFLDKKLQQIESGASCSDRVWHKELHRAAEKLRLSIHIENRDDEAATGE